MKPEYVYVASSSVPMTEHARFERRIIGTERRSRWYKRTGRCGVVDPGYGACQQPAPHEVRPGFWHLEMRQGKVWAEWSGR
jgi:hypothetical protein